MDPTHRVLVVDPCPDTAASTAWLLRLWGHDVRVAGDGPAAVEAAFSYRPDAVVMEIALPGLDGCAVARRLLRPDGCPQALLVAVTGLGSATYRRRCLAAGFHFLLLKPVPPDHLRALLDVSRARSARPGRAASDPFAERPGRVRTADP